MKKVNLLIFQYHPIVLDWKANILKMERLIKKNIHLKPDIVVFPEYSLTGPLYSNYNLSFTKEHEVFVYLSEIAKKYNIYLVPGSFILKVNDSKYNSSCMLDNMGRVINFYYKQSLWSSEKKFLQSGDEDFVFRTKFGKIALQICADLHSSKISDAYRALRPDIIINTSMWALEDSSFCTKKVPDNIEFLQTEILSKARAIENKCYFVFCNFAGKITIRAKTGREYPESSIGNSIIVNPYGEIITKATNNNEQFLFCQVNVRKTYWSKYNV